MLFLASPCDHDLFSFQLKTACMRPVPQKEINGLTMHMCFFFLLLLLLLLFVNTLAPFIQKEKKKKAEGRKGDRLVRRTPEDR